MKAVSGVYRLNYGGYEVDKVVLGVRLRAVFPTQREANAWVSMRGEEIRREKRFGERPVIRFDAAVQKYLEGKLAAGRPSVTTDVYLFKPMLPFVGHVQLSKISDQSFDEFRAHRAEAGKSAKTIHLSLSAAQTVLNFAEKKWRWPGSNLSYLDRAPSISLPSLTGRQRPPRPITWAEQDQLLAELPPHLQVMALFCLNTGLRDDPLVNLRWAWLEEFPELNTYIFVVPALHVKGRAEDKVLVLNSIAKSIIDKQRGKHEEYVFVYRRERVTNLDRPPQMEYAPITTMNNTAWNSARVRIGLDDLHVHDLRHTFAARLGAAEVTERTAKALLWHGTISITQHYMSGYVIGLEQAVNRIVDRPQLDDIPLAALMRRRSRKAP